MNENEVILTQDGLDELKNELKNLLEVVRPDVIKELVEARAQGDLSENADYDAARNRQAEVESRIKELETIVSKAKVIDSKSDQVKKAKEVKLGSKLVLLNLKENKEMEVKIVGQIEAEPFENKISNESPMAKAVMGKTIGDETEVKGIKEPYRVKIISILN